MIYQKRATFSKGKIPFLCRIWHLWQLEKFHEGARYLICDRCKARKIESLRDYHFDVFDLDWLDKREGYEQTRNL